MSLEAFDAAVKKNAIGRALKLDYKLTGQQILTLRTEFEQALEEKTFRQGNKPVTFRVPRSKLN